LRPRDIDGRYTSRQMSRNNPSGMRKSTSSTWSTEVLGVSSHVSGGSAKAVDAAKVTRTAGSSARTRAARRTTGFSGRFVTSTG
jgi:hypothetical protein